MDVLARIRTACVEVNVVLCRMRFTLGEVATLGSGDVLEAELGDPPVNVELDVNGKTAAKGRLLIRDGLRCVEITEVGKRPLRKFAPVKWTLR